MIKQQFETPGEALAHHGVKGMKWGVRKEDPTGGRSSAKAGDLVGVDPVTAAVGVFYVGLVLAKLHDLHRQKKDSGKNHQKANANVPWKKNPELSKTPMSIDDIQSKVVAQVNPKYGEPGTKMNCRRCTYTYEMRRRGNEVQATRSKYATGQDTQGTFNAIKNAGMHESVLGEKRIDNPNAPYFRSGDEKSSEIFDRLNKEPNGSRGELTVSWQFGGGHSMAYEVIDHKAVIFDTQSKETFKDAKSMSDLAGYMGQSAYTRLDDKELNEDFLRRWVTNA